MLPLPSRPELRARLPRLLVGLVLFGIGLALMVASELGLAPWEVLHQGISFHTGISIGAVGIITGFIVLLAWLPIRERFGMGTVLNVIVIGVVIDATLWALPETLPGLGTRWVALLGGIVIIGIGSGFYIGAGLGPGPRDGLMTGIARRGHRVAKVRTIIEITALGAGWLLGGTVGVGTALFAFGIGPIVQVSLDRLSLAPVAAKRSAI
ncbi:MAG TPA: hypothetical protein VGC47_01300 [Acidimicrobiia bacterium]